MDKSLLNNEPEHFSSNILEEMNISWNDSLESRTNSLYEKVSRVIPKIEWNMKLINRDIRI